jgi:hypothetical protein
MIKPSKDGNFLWFIPPEGSTIGEAEYPLVYANTCPKCNNLIQAVFMTNKKVDPKPWEEIFTQVLDANGKYKRIIPGRSKRSRSRYSVTTLGRGSIISAQLIRYTDHFDRKEDVNNTPICKFVALSSVIPEYRIYDMLLTHFLDPSKYDIKDSDYDSIKDRLLTNYSGTDQYAFVEAIGKGPECVLVSRTAYQWFMQEVTNKYAKPYQPSV